MKASAASLSEQRFELVCVAARLCACFGKGRRRHRSFPGRFCPVATLRFLLLLLLPISFHQQSIGILTAPNPISGLFIAKLATTPPSFRSLFIRSCPKKALSQGTWFCLAQAASSTTSASAVSITSHASLLCPLASNQHHGHCSICPDGQPPACPQAGS